MVTRKTIEWLELIEESGVCKLKAYKCPAGKWTFGWGDTEGCFEGATITKEEADIRLFRKAEKITKYIQRIEPFLALRMNENQWVALTSLIYNIGQGEDGFTGSTIRKELAKKEWSRAAIENAWNMWNKITVNGKKVVSTGLVKRRKKELALFFEPWQESIS